MALARLAAAVGNGACEESHHHPSGHAVTCHDDLLWDGIDDMAYRQTSGNGIYLFNVVACYRCLKANALSAASFLFEQAIHHPTPANVRPGGPKAPQNLAASAAGFFEGNGKRQ